MGTASLVIGLALIALAFYFLLMSTTAETEEESDIIFALKPLFFIVLITVGALLLRKFDIDRKKEKKS